MRTTTVDLFAFGNSKRARLPRRGQDVFLDEFGSIVPTTPPMGASFFADPLRSCLKGHYHKLPAGTALPEGLEIVADGQSIKMEFLAQQADRVAVLGTALRGKDRHIALSLALRLTEEEKKQLFPEWVHLARCAHSPFYPAWKTILSLPRDWVLANIEREADRILETEEETDYWMFLQLFEQLDHNLALKLARRAAAHADADIRELGVDWIERLEGASTNGQSTGQL